MEKYGKDFYEWMYSEVKTTYEEWGTDMMSMYKHHIKEDLPNISKAISEMYNNFDEENYYKAEIKPTFKRPKYVYQALSNLIPQYDIVRYNFKTRELNKSYKSWNMCSWKKPVSIHRIDLLITIMLFTEGFIFEKLSDENIAFYKNELVVYENFCIFRVLKNKEQTVVAIEIKGEIVLEYMILN